MKPTIKSLYLAPMEGVMDALMRELITSFGGIDLCFTEFVRIVDEQLPKRVFYRLCPELYNGGKTKSGIPVRVQLLGNNPQAMAQNALLACELGSHGIDLNFGCPAKTVNKNLGGAALLKEPQQIYQIIKTVRQAVPAHLPVSAKIRLGWECLSLLDDTIAAINSAAASELIVHARTKIQGYKPPAHWHEIQKIQQVANMPVIANGDINCHTSATECMAQSGCDMLMIGRGVCAQPNLAQQIKSGANPLKWNEILQLLRQYSKAEIQGDKGKYFPNRLKQWLKSLQTKYPPAEQLFSEIRALKNTDEVLRHFMS